MWPVPCGLVSVLGMGSRTTCWSTRDWKFYNLVLHHREFWNYILGLVTGPFLCL